MRAHGGRRDLLGQGEVSRVEGAANDGRAFDEIREGRCEIRVRFDGAADLAREAAGGFEDREPPRFSIRLDVVGAELREVIVHAADRELLV